MSERRRIEKRAELAYTYTGQPPRDWVDCYREAATQVIAESMANACMAELEKRVMAALARQTTFVIGPKGGPVFVPKGTP